jgi:Uma2 family endonuclease
MLTFAHHRHFLQAVDIVIDLRYQRPDTNRHALPNLPKSRADWGESTAYSGWEDCVILTGMSATGQSKTSGDEARTTDPRPRLWTREEYYRVAEEGLFYDEKVELIGGEVVTLNPQRAEHFVCLDKVADLLKEVFGKRYWVRRQGPLACSQISEPEPDVSVVRGSRSDYRDHPATAVLVVEVSQTTLEYDRTRKASLYAATGIPEYWIVNLVDRVVEVYSSPIPDAAQPFGHCYADSRRLEPNETLAPAEFPESQLSVADLLT